MSPSLSLIGRNLNPQTYLLTSSGLVGLILESILKIISQKFGCGCLSVSVPPADLLDLIETGHGDVGLLLLAPSRLLSFISSTAALRLRAATSLLRLGDVDGGRTGALEAVLSLGGAPAQQGRQLQLLSADAGGAPGGVGAVGGAGRIGRVVFSSSSGDRRLGLLCFLHGIHLESTEHLRFEVEQEALRTVGNITGGYYGMDFMLFEAQIQMYALRCFKY